MIVERSGNLLTTEAEALVNTVNTVGIMGKGVALQFKQAFPENFRAYEAACRRGEVQLGRMFVTQTGLLTPRFIVNFPTKGHWKGNSKLGDIEAGLTDLVRFLRAEQISSIAMPPLGSGLGGLRWEDVRALIERSFADLPNVEVILFPPGQAIAPEERTVRTIKRPLTDWGAALIKIVEAYSALGFEATHIEAQKLLYFLYRAGQRFKGSFVEGPYGPYDPNMKFGLQNMEGHYVIGFGDGGVMEPVRLKPGAANEADEHLRASDDAGAIYKRIERINRLIEGFETPYGLELLATVDWVVTQKGAASEDEAVRMSHEWNARKAKALKETHLRIAYRTLKEHAWI